MQALELMPKGFQIKSVATVKIVSHSDNFENKLFECSLGMKHEHPQMDNCVLNPALLSPSVIL